MIIKKVIIKNFRSYYGENTFEFSDGLTLIIGDNGDGKTTFFEALQWLLDTTKDNNSIENVSEMCKSQMTVGDSEELKISMVFEHAGEKSIEKSYSFEKKSDNYFNTSRINFRGYESNGTERISVDGKTLIDRCFDAFMQRFSMFKGESNLNVFNSETALKDLVDKFSDIRKFDNLVEITKTMEEKSNAAFIKECKSDKKISAQADELGSEIQCVIEDINNKKKEIREKQKTVSTFSSNLEKLEKNQDTVEKYQEVSDRLKNLSDKALKLKGMIGAIDKDTALLDRLWILCAFPPVFSEFTKKSSALSKEKRIQEKKFNEQRGMKLGKLETLKEIRNALSNGAAELPWYLPDQQTMEEMIKDHICKVCGREAPEGSEAYNFMVNRLEEYKQRAEAKLKREKEISQIENEKLFVNDYIEEIHNLSIGLSGIQEQGISNKAKEIDERLALEQRWTNELSEINDKIQKSEEDKARLLIQAGNVSEEYMEKDFKDLKQMFTLKGDAEKRLVELQRDLTDLENERDDLKLKFEELNPQSNQVVVYKEVHRAFEAIAKAFLEAKCENLRRFLSSLEECANEYLEKLSAEDFRGEIALCQTANESTEIKLFSSNGTEIKNPSGSQETVMYMSVLFAINDFSDKKRDENYPLIFDAATSSFGDRKENEFYNVIDKLKKQCIIVTKDFITKGEIRMKDINALTCQVYRIKKAPDFDVTNMATIRTEIEKIK